MAGFKQNILLILAFNIASMAISQPGSDYQRVDAGDVVQLILPTASELEGLYDVDKAGRILLPLIGFISVNKKKVAEIERLLADSLLQYVKRVNGLQVKLIENNKFIIVLGHVAKPGNYKVPDQTSLQELLFLAGGSISGALLNKIEIRRETSSGRKRIFVRYNEFLLTGDDSLIPKLESGDNIFVPKGFKELASGEKLVCVFGEINHSGTYEITDRTTLLDAISQAGGTTANADLQKIRLVRGGLTDESAISVNLERLLKNGDTTSIPYLKNGDTVFVEARKKHWFWSVLTLLSGILTIYSAYHIYSTR